MKSWPLVRRQAALTCFGIVAMHLAQHLLCVTAFVGEALCDHRKLSASVPRQLARLISVRLNAPTSQKKVASREPANCHGSRRRRC